MIFVILGSVGKVGKAEGVAVGSKEGVPVAVGSKEGVPVAVGFKEGVPVAVGFKEGLSVRAAPLQIDKNDSNMPRANKTNL